MATKITDTQLTERTGYNFTDGAPRTQYDDDKIYKLVNGCLFSRPLACNTWDVVAEIIWTDDYKFSA